MELVPALGIVKPLERDIPLCLVLASFEIKNDNGELYLNMHECQRLDSKAINCSWKE